MMIALLAGCSGSRVESPDAPASVGGAELTIQMVTSPSTIGGVAPAQGSTFLLIDLTLTNTASATPLKTQAAMFTLTTSHKVGAAPAAVQAQLMTPCNGTAVVIQGGLLACGVVYEVAGADKALALHYDDAMGHSSSVAVPAATAPDACVQIGTYTKLNSTACQQCEVQNCAAIIQNANTECANMSCMQCAGMAGKNGCTCQQQCYSSTCWGDLEMSFACILQMCSSACM